MSFSWSGRVGGLFRVMHVRMDADTVGGNLNALEHLATGIGLVPKAVGNVVVIDTTPLPRGMLNVTHVPRTITKYKTAFPHLKRYIHTTVLVVVNPFMRTLINTVIAVMSKTATEVRIVSSAAEAQAIIEGMEWAAHTGSGVAPLTACDRAVASTI